MSERALIDTDILSYILKRKEPAYKNSVSYLKEYKKFSISCISYYECVRGYKAVGATRRLKVFSKLLKITDVIWLNEQILDKAGEIYGFLKKRGELKGEFDLLIGATAIVKELRMITNNEKHYKPLQEHFNLEIENWMKNSR